MGSCDVCFLFPVGQSSQKCKLDENKWNVSEFLSLKAKTKAPHSEERLAHRRSEHSLLLKEEEDKPGPYQLMGVTVFTTVMKVS